MTKATKTRAVPILAALMIILMATLATACSSDTPEPGTDPSRQDLLDTIERMDREMNTLQEEVEELRKPAETVESRTITLEPAKTRSTMQTATPTPEMTRTPAESGPGICGRTPEIQKAILESLDIDLCQVITPGEMFRITSFKVKTDTVRPGDFQGMINVKEMEVETRIVETGAFTGLDGLEEMQLTAYTYGAIAAGAFQGLAKLEEMTIQTSSPSSGEYTLSLPDFDPMENLKHLKLGEIPTLYPDTISGDLFTNLPSLETVELQILRKETENGETEVHLLPVLFASNRTLKAASMKIAAQVSIPQGFFANNPLLEEIQISGASAVNENTFRHLENLEILRIRDNRNGDHEIVLSEKSPLYNKIRYGNEGTYGYKIVNIED